MLTEGRRKNKVFPSQKEYKKAQAVLPIPKSPSILDVPREPLQHLSRKNSLVSELSSEPGWKGHVSSPLGSLQTIHSLPSQCAARYPPLGLSMKITPLQECTDTAGLEGADGHSQESSPAGKPPLTTSSWGQSACTQSQRQSASPHHTEHTCKKPLFAWSIPSMLASLNPFPNAPSKMCNASQGTKGKPFRGHLLLPGDAPLPPGQQSDLFMSHPSPWHQQGF